MSEVTVSLRTGHYAGEMHQPGVGTSKLEFEVVKGLQLPGSTPLEFEHHMLPNEGDSAIELALPEEMALKLSAFSEACFVEGRGDFDCRAFLGYVMGWDKTIKTNTNKNYMGNQLSASETKAGLPYLIMQSDAALTPHAMMGIDQPGQSLGVMGFECSMGIANNNDLVRAFGGVALLEVTKVEEL
ncbi:hypothetical protein CYG49_00320 [Candidatus Saccharibacteria bacterium]|nr:MAG: hypothetical protein CYG49_00320 [Candidatus Saccharibacteria bacterium]